MTLKARGLFAALLRIQSGEGKTFGGAGVTGAWIYSFRLSTDDGGHVRRSHETRNCQRHRYRGTSDAPRSLKRHTRIFPTPTGCSSFIPCMNNSLEATINWKLREYIYVNHIFVEAKYDLGTQSRFDDILNRFKIHLLTFNNNRRC